MRGPHLILGLACMLLAAPVVAGTVYRCDTPDGARSYVSKRLPGAKCHAVTTDAPPPVRKPAPAATAAVKATSPASGQATARAPDPNAPASFLTPTSGSAAPATILANAAPVTPVQPSSGGARRVQGQVYSYIKDGVRHYTSTRPKGVASASAVRTIQYSYLETCFACAKTPGVNFGNVRLNREAYRDEIAAAARAHGIDEAIVRAIIHAESAFNPNALSRVGAQGLMQLMPATARRFKVTNAFDAGQNIQGGVEYLAWLLKRFDGDLTLAAAGYNAGEGAVDKYKGVPPYGETQLYVKRVGVLAERYRSTN